MKKFLLILIPLAIVLAGIYYWLFMRAGMPDPRPNNTGGVTDIPTFNPLNTGGEAPVNQGGAGSALNGGITEQPIASTNTEIPKLRQLSATPVGGFMASTTASSTVARFVDRGVGHVFEANSIDPNILRISNTTIPRVYESYWNKNGSAAIFRYSKDEEGTIANFFAELRSVKNNASSTETESVPYEIKGKFISSAISEIAVSPKGDRVFTLSRESGKTTGYISGFDETRRTEIISTPLEQINVEWPEENTVAINTKASAIASGYLYLVDLKKPSLKKVVGGVAGLSSKVSRDAKKVLYSSSRSRGFTTYILNRSDNSTQDIVFRTPAEKCVWSKLVPTDVYCAVPTEFPSGIYPDDWYKGNISFVDQIWRLDTLTGEVALIANPLNLANTLMDVINPTLDPKEEYLYFMNKRDLTLWSLDLSE